MNETLGAGFLASSTVGELQRSAHFAVDIAGLSREVTLLTKSFPIPTGTSEVIDIVHGNEHFKAAGPMNYESGDMTLYDSITLDTEMALQEWRNAVQDPNTGNMGAMRDYKRDATVTEYSPDGTIQRQWKLEGVWPSAFKPGDLAKDNTGLKEVSITLVVQKCYRIK